MSSDPPTLTTVSMLEREQAERNEAPQVVAHRAYAEALLRAQDDGGGYQDVMKCEEIALKAALIALQRHYQLQAKSWLERLSRIEAIKPITITRFLDGTLRPGGVRE